MTESGDSPSHDREPEPRGTRTPRGAGVLRAYWLFLAGLIFLGGVQMLGERLEFTAWGSEGLALVTEGVELLVFMVALATIWSPAWFLVLRVRRLWSQRESRSGRFTGWVVIYFVVSVGFFFGGFLARHAYTRPVQVRARIVGLAIQTFTRERGSVPLELEALVPEFLEETPRTGVGRSPHFGYLRGNAAEDRFGAPWVLYTEAGRLGEFVTCQPGDGVDGTSVEVWHGYEYRIAPQ